MVNGYGIDEGSGVLYRTEEPGVSALAGVEVPFLPEPVEGGRTESERQRFQDAMAHMARALHGLSTEGDESAVARTFELRIAAPPRMGGARTLALFFLVRSLAATNDDRDPRAARALAIDDAVRMSRMLISLAPQRLPCELVDWSSQSESEGDDPLARSGLTWDLPFVAHLRKQEILTWAKELDFVDVEERLERSRGRRAERERSRGLVVPALLPSSRGDFLAVASLMTQAPGAVVLRVGLEATSLTKDEYKALTEMNRDLVALEEAGSPTSALLKKARAAVDTTLAADGFFRFSAQVLGDDPESVQSVVAVWKMEHDRGERAPGFETPTATPVASAVSDATDAYGRAAAQFESGSGSARFDRTGAMSNLRQADDRLVRLGSIVSLVEAPSLWKLPTLMPGGQAGLRSRPSNPFEQLPLSTDERFDGKDLIRVGAIRHRGVSLPSNFVLNAGANGREIGPSVLDRVMVVAGSPGSGKTNFALGFLDEMWTRTRTPFLVLDPTLGREFRGLAPDDLVVFTVGDQRGNPFSFNPFSVPAGVSVQTHITRLMSCFRSAFWMWDPLPAIFEEAIRLAYARRLGVGKMWNAASTFGEDVVTGFPTFRDLVGAMDVVLARQEKLWAAGGEATANQATIVASTSLRLESLVRNYGHVMGADDRGSKPVDVSKMLRRPVVLELGAIGDGQALSLIASFLLVNLVGCIETQGASAEGDAGYHMLVIEEAHRLLSSGTVSATAESGNARAQAADDLNNMLAEVRKYGQGVMILDQRPGSLVGGVIDNAAVVALHKLNEQKGFDHLADMLNLSTEQRRFARVGLEAGESIMFDPLLRAAVLVKPDLRMERPGDVASEYDGPAPTLGTWRERSVVLQESLPPQGAASPTERSRQAAGEVLDGLDPNTPEGDVVARVRHSIAERSPGLSRKGVARACRYVLRGAGDGAVDDEELVAAMVHVLVSEDHQTNERGGP